MAVAPALLAGTQAAPCLAQSVLGPTRAQAHRCCTVVVLPGSESGGRNAQFALGQRPAGLALVHETHVHTCSESGRAPADNPVCNTDRERRSSCREGGSSRVSYGGGSTAQGHGTYNTTRIESGRNLLVIPARMAMEPSPQPHSTSLSFSTRRLSTCASSVLLSWRWAIPETQTSARLASGWTDDCRSLELSASHRGAISVRVAWRHGASVRRISRRSDPSLW